ncbi:MAG: class I SAM-dependent methyltransferase [Nocardioidaceae bacterium]|nr:class I SAM-dependent methyltransferase [Nocardioidaceae bacterium]
MATDVEVSYSIRAEEYIELLGSTTASHLSDVQLITSWAREVDGPVVDAGCGPGHWTSHLVDHGVDARGIDQVAGFIRHARETYPAVSFEVGSIDALPYDSDSVGGVLAWYSLIHHPPATIGLVLSELARVLRPGGALLIGFFIGPAVEAFDHSIVTAYRWPAEALIAELRSAGLEMVEIHTRTGAQPKPRPHGAILARRSDDRTSARTEQVC